MTVSTNPALLSFADARQLVEQQAATVSPTDAELTSLLDAVGLALAEDLRADRDFPPFPRATRDGYAVRAADVPCVTCGITLHWNDQGRSRHRRARTHTAGR